MKLAMVLLVLLPLVLARPQPDKRTFVSDILDLKPLKRIVLAILLHLGSDPTEQQCEASCHEAIMSETSVLHYGCDFVCNSFQSLVKLFYPDPLAEAPVGRSL